MSCLDIWMKYAKEMGYGCSYGQCMADVLSGRLPPPPELAPVTPDDPNAKKCRYCGSWFVPKHRSQAYCENLCQVKMQQQRYRERHEGAIAQQRKTCRTCAPHGRNAQ